MTIEPATAEASSKQRDARTKAQPRGNVRNFLCSLLVSDVVEACGHVAPKHLWRADGHVEKHPGFGDKNMPEGRQRVRRELPALGPKAMCKSTQGAFSG
jgi:hypothetical protein